MFIKLYVLEPQIKETFKAKLLPGYFLNWKLCENGLIYYEKSSYYEKSTTRKKSPQILPKFCT